MIQYSEEFTYEGLPARLATAGYGATYLEFRVTELHPAGGTLEHWRWRPIHDAHERDALVEFVNEVSRLRRENAEREAAIASETVR